MSKKIAALAIAGCTLSLVALGVAGMAWWQSWLDQPLEKAPLAAPIEIGDVAGVTATDGDLALELRSLDDGGNTQLIWHCGKRMAGMRYDYAAAWTQVQGRVLLTPATHTLRAGEIHVTIGAMRGHGAHPTPNALINTVRANRWFLLDEHPTAVIRGSSIVPRGPGETSDFAAAVDGWTHTLSGTIALNGVERPLAAAAKVEVGDDGVRIDAAFPISRAAFGVAGRQGFEPPSEVDDEVVIEVHVHATRDPLGIVAELSRQLVAQQASIASLTAQVADSSARLERAESALDELRRKFATAAAGPQSPAVDVATLPARFTDQVDYRNAAGDARRKDLGYAPEFEMVLVPGDPAAGIAPFYVQTTEVTWQMFRAWSYCEDVADDTKVAELRAADLRPSPCYDDASRGFGFEGRAALGLSRRNALAFCRFLSERTGRSYRLMSGAEWAWLAKAAGGVPQDPQAVAWLRSNADTDLFGEPMPMPVGTKPANQLGLFDFWGNVAEWVMDDTQYLRGGSYLSENRELTLDWRADESQDVWNATYPNTPKSRWWYRDRFDMGFRLVCDPVNIPSGR
ncbi:MAG: SUMF1/EgtB/PvdO family nonheme iron enzyme [Planctomycetes bacterium]|nr:SUMF1/EgtB/PvdO family nonheme iron enzyme [Planctomycetota bacterium]